MPFRLRIEDELVNGKVSVLLSINSKQPHFPNPESQGMRAETRDPGMHNQKEGIPASFGTTHMPGRLRIDDGWSDAVRIPPP